METIASDRQEEIAFTYQCIEVSRLDRVLRDNGVESEQVRRKICETYFFQHGIFLDQCWFLDDGVRYNPSLCFIEQSPETRKDVRLIHRRAEACTELHGSAYGALVWLYDDGGEPPVQVGFVPAASLSTGLILAPGGDPAAG
jgi:hypothetical protein